VTRRRAALAVCAAAVVCGPAPANAQGPSGITMQAVGQPSYFTLSARPGSVVTGRVLLTNLSDEPQLVRLAAVDVGVAETGGLSYGTGRPLGIGHWVHPAATAVPLAAHRHRTVAFRVAVPKRAIGGDHYAALTAAATPRSVQTRAGRRTINLRFLTRMAIAVQVRLPGPRVPGLQVGSAGVRVTGVPALVLALANPGTGLLPAAQVDLAVSQGTRRLFGIRQRLGAFVPHGRLTFENRWPVRLAAGHYRLDGTIVAAGRTIPVHRRLTIAGSAAPTSSPVSVEAQPSTPHTAPSWALLLAAAFAAIGMGVAAGVALSRR
jgi:hypothetical protein